MHGPPPRGRRALLGLELGEHRQRITSAQAESTHDRAEPEHDFADHLRAGGEHSGRKTGSTVDSGSPPRRRRAPVVPRPTALRLRITSAQAESTCARPARHPARPDHLRAGGEHSASRRTVRGTIGSPPRRRRARRPAARPARARRITSAQAESTVSRSLIRLVSADHLRAGGEHCPRHSARPHVVGSPPRRRRAHPHGSARPSVMRITSAQAESTSRSPQPRSGASDHLRAGGEHPS